MGKLYSKIPGPFLRSPETNLLTQEMTSEELNALADIEWEFTEKIDGTNIRVMWDGYRVTFGGRTDKADLPKDLLEYLTEQFGGEEKETLFEQKFGTSEVVIYGEGYGPKIQNGGKYRKTVSFAVFDVLIGDTYLLRDNVVDIADYFGVEVVPVVMQGTLWEAIDKVSNGLTSAYGGFRAEGLVGRTKLGLLDRRGNRIIVKIKTRDFF